MKRNRMVKLKETKRNLMVKHSCHSRVSETEAGAAGSKASSATLEIKDWPGLQETLSKSSISQNNGFCIFFCIQGGLFISWINLRD